ncbi:hypothetical protein AX14_001225 [Amanita brunnescens Koide BX004]|nr:hypothetical protein AX14_001225 [Amanita brunnescens Koide BX004]
MSKSINPQPPVTTTRRKPERKLSVSGTHAENAEPASSDTYVIPSTPPTLFSAMRSLFAYIAYHPLQKGTIAPRAFIEKLKELNELFRSNMHQDAHEFLMFLLNRVVEEIEEGRKHAQQSEDLSNSIATLSPPPTIVTAQTTSSNSGTSPHNATLVHKLFEGVLTSETRCLTCETVSSRDESFLDLSIDIERNASVTACLRQFSASEMLSQRNKFFCDSCCSLQEAEKRMKIKRLPNVLTLHLKRFKYQEDVQKYIKLTYRVAFPFELRLFNTVDGAEDADRLYNLYAIVVHIGNGPHHGHYITIIKTHAQWFVFDDDNVYPIPEQDISKYFGDSNSGAAYLLYYQAADIDRAALGLPMPSPVEEPKDVASTNHASASPVQEIQPRLSSDTSNDHTAKAKTEDSLLAPLLQSEKQFLDSHSSTPPLSANVESELNPSSSHLTQSNGTISHKPSAGGIFTGLRSSTSFSRPKTPNLDSRRMISVQDHMLPLSHPSDANKLPSLSPKSPKRPATSAGSLSRPGEKEKESEKAKTRKETDSRPSWFRRRSFKGSDKPRPMSAESLIAPPLPMLDISGQTSSVSSSAKDPAVAAPPLEHSGGHSHSSGKNGTRRPHSSSGLLDLGIHPDSRHSQHRSHNTNEQASSSTGNSISSYGSSLSHPPLLCTSAQSSSSPPTTPSSLSSHHQSSRTQSQIPNSSRGLEHKKSMPESHGSKRKLNSRPLPPIPSLHPSVSHDAAPAVNGNHMLEPGSPARSTPTMMSTSSHVKQSSSHHASGPPLLGTEARDGFNKQIRRVSKKLSFSAPFLHFGRKDKDKHREKEMSSQAP